MKRVRIIALAAGLVAFATVFHTHAQQEPSTARQTFETNCAACHGPGGAGGDRAPALIDNPDLRKLSAANIENIIRTGTSGGMPAFSSLPASEVAALAGWIHSMNLPALVNASSEQIAAGERFFFGEGGCSSCHMVHGRGAVNGPDLTNIAARSTLAEIEKILDDPTSQMGVHSLDLCPPWAFCPDFSWAVLNVTLKNGAILRGFGHKRTEHELQLQSFDGKMRLLDAAEYTLVRQEK
jgi:mono/diheme cytochrome c family protein